MKTLGVNKGRHNNLKVAFFTLLMSVILSACGSPTERISKAVALELLNAGEVTEIGVTHSGWTTMTLNDGSYVQNLADVIGYPAELLEGCSNCENIIQWIE